MRLRINIRDRLFGWVRPTNPVIFSKQQTINPPIHSMGKGGDSSGRIFASKAIASTSTVTNDDVDAAVKPVAETATNNDNTATNTIQRPWWRRGGFHVNVVGMGFNVAIPPYILATTAASTSLHDMYTPTQIYLVALLVQLTAAIAEGKRTFFCFCVVPVYLTSLLLIPPTLTPGTAVPAIALAFLLTAFRIGICMSVCLHRYAAHAAFKCGPFTRFFLNVVGCAANQGGPIWWASQHRCHHKHCDASRDPHSAAMHGVERAFAFFGAGYDAVEEEFAPRHNDGRVLRVLDTFAFAICSIELAASYHIFGREGLFVTYTSMWMCQAGSLWFNITNHPLPITSDDDTTAKLINGPATTAAGSGSRACLASNGKGRANGWYPAFWFLDFICGPLSTVASESAHADHHDHFMLAKRDEYDCMYYVFVRPLELMGLIWDVKTVPLPE